MCKTNPIWRIGRGPRGQNAQNERNSRLCPVRGGLGDEGRGGKTCKTNPIWPPCPEMGADSHASGLRRELIVQNEANFRLCPAGEGLGEEGLREKTCKTKPIPGRARWDQAQETRAAESNHAKRSQFDPPGVREWARTGLRPTSIVQNEANLRRSIKFEV